MKQATSSKETAIKIGSRESQESLKGVSRERAVSNEVSELPHPPTFDLPALFQAFLQLC